MSPQLASTELGSDRMFLVLDYQPRTQLTVETSYKELKLEMRAEKTTEGRQFFVEMWREGVKNINYNLDVQYQEVSINNSITQSFIFLNKLFISLSDRRRHQHPLKI